MTLPSTHCNGEWKRRVLKLWVCLIGGALQLNTGKFHWAYKRQRETGAETETETERQGQRQRQTETEIDRGRDWDRQEDSERERDRDRDRKTGRQRQTDRGSVFCRNPWFGHGEMFMTVSTTMLSWFMKNRSEVSRVWGLRFLDIHLLWCIGREVLWESFCNNCGHWGKCIEEYCNRKYYILLIKYIQNWAAEIDQKCTTTCF